MTTTTATLTEFLLARVSDDEAVAKAALDAPESTWWVDPRKQRTVRGAPSTRVPIAEGLGWQTAAHIARHDPPRVLAECAAKRVAVDWYLNDDSVVMASTIRAMAAVYADHPDYDEAWRP